MCTNSYIYCRYNASVVKNVNIKLQPPNYNQLFRKRHDREETSEKTLVIKITSNGKTSKLE